MADQPDHSADLVATTPEVEALNREAEARMKERSLDDPWEDHEVVRDAETVVLASKDMGRLLTLSTLYAFINGAIDVARGGNERWIVSDLEELSEGINKAVEKVMARVTHNDGQISTSEGS